MSQDTMALIKTLKNDSSWEARRDAAKSLSNIKESKVVDALIYAAENDKESIVRAAAVSELGEIGDERAFPHLASIINGNDQYVAHSCAYALTAFGAKGIDVLTNALQSNNSHIRKSVIEALGYTKNPVVLTILLRVVKDPVGWVAVEAIEVLGELGDPSTASALIELMQSETRPELLEMFKKTMDKWGVDIPDSIASVERRSKEVFLSNLKALRVGMSEDEVFALVGGGDFAMGTRIVYKHPYGEFQLIIANGRLVEFPEGFGPASLIKELEADLSSKD